MISRRKRLALIFITILPVNSDYAKRYGFKELFNNNIDVYLINIFNWMHNKHKKKALRFASDSESIMGIKPLMVDSKEMFIQIVENIKEKKIAFMTLANPSHALIKTFREINLPYMVHSTYGSVSVENKSFLRRLANLGSLKKINLPYISSWASKKMLKDTVREYPPVFHVAMNNRGCFFGVKSKKILNHSFDYDRYLKNKAIQKPDYILKKEYILLLPHHPWGINNWLFLKALGRPPITKEQYRVKINKVVTALERGTGMEMIIAGYPNATEAENIYDNKRMLLGSETEQLVKYASVVIGHHTGGLNFAVIHNKPVFMINFRELDNNEVFKTNNRIYADQLGVNVYYVDTDMEIRTLNDDILRRQKTFQYKEFFRKYLRSEEVGRLQEELYWNRVAAYLKMWGEDNK